LTSPLEFPEILSQVLPIIKYENLMKLIQLDAFLRFAETENITRAAAEIGISQPRVSQRLKELEHSLGVDLLVRDGRKVSLSPAGRRLVPHARKILSDCKEAAAIARGESSAAQIIRIGAPESVCAYFLSLGLEDHKKRFPGTSVQLIPGASETLLQVLEACELDIAFVLAPLVDHKGLIVQPLLMFDLIPFSAPPSRRHMTPMEFARNSVFLTEAGCSYRHRIETRFGELGAPLAQITEFTSVEAIKKCVMAGSGTSVLPSFALRQEFETGKLRPVSVSGFQETTYLQAVSRPHCPLSDQVGHFVSAVARGLDQTTISSNSIAQHAHMTAEGKDNT
jgi:DNA-binding transcriptional LysR family regulator